MKQYVLFAVALFFLFIWNISFEIDFKENSLNGVIKIESFQFVFHASVKSAHNESETNTGNDFIKAEDVISEIPSVFENLCKDQNVENIRDSSLKCYYSSEGIGYFIIQPVKIEEHHLHPLVVQFYDVISEKDAEELKNMAKPILAPAKIKNFVKGESANKLSSNTRKSETAFLHRNNESKTIDKIYKKVSLMTGLSANVEDYHVEPIQIGHYGPGGFYRQHKDYFIKDQPEENIKLIEPFQLAAGDRTATFMFYLSNVTKGGSTVFTELGITIKPKIYSAVFWYNLKRNGEGIHTTLHGGCPILEGEKWVANLWFRANGQIFARPCSLKMYE